MLCRLFNRTDPLTATGTMLMALGLLMLVAGIAAGKPPQCTLPDRAQLAKVWVVGDGRTCRSVTDLPARSPAATPCGRKKCDCGCAEGEPCRCLSGKKSPRVTKGVKKDVKKGCQCSGGCTCGCNEGGPCTCGQKSVSRFSENFRQRFGNYPCVSVVNDGQGVPITNLPLNCSPQCGVVGCGEPCGEPCGGRAVPLARGSSWSASWGHTGTCAPVAPARPFVSYQPTSLAPAFSQAPMMQAPVMQSFRPAMNFGGGMAGGGFRGGFGGRSFGGGGGCST